MTLSTTSSTMAATQTYTYQVELVNSVLDDWELISAHRSEVEQVERGEFCPDREFYNALESMGRLVTYTVRYNDKLVGYQFTMLQNSHHTKGTIQGVVDVIYVCPQHRGACGRNLIVNANKHLDSLGVTDLYHFIPLAREWGSVLKRMGFKHIENVYHKGLAWDQ